MTPSDLIKIAIARFLSTTTPEVLCIKGRWGTGKTYTWREAVIAASAKGGIALDTYAYVSLFGINSLEELKYAIFTNTLPKNNVTGTVSLETISSSISGLRKLLTNSSFILDLIPYTKGVNSAIAPALFMTVKNRIVCLDDLERRGQKLDLADVLGLVSYVKEERQCKVALLLNDEAFVETAKDTFSKYLEKVVDTTLAYKTTAQESLAKAGLRGDTTGVAVSDHCASLGISNIRVIKKIDHIVRLSEPHFSSSHSTVRDAATASLVLFCWAFHQPDDAPTFDFFRTKKTEGTYGLKAENLNAKEIAWNALLRSYGFGWVDELDLVLMKAVEDGYFNPDDLEKPLAKANEKAHATEADGSFENAWKKYHESFHDNETEALDAIFKSFMRNINYISPINLNGTVRLFKDLGRSDEAKAMIKEYLAKRSEGSGFYDLTRYPFGGEIGDEDVRGAFAAKLASFAQKTVASPDLFLKLKDGEWDPGALDAIAALPVEDYYQIIVNAEGPDLRRIISGCLQFNRISNATDSMRLIASKATAALKKIAATSDINRRRVASLGIALPGPEDQKPADAPVEPG